MTTVAIIDDHKVVAEGFEHLINEYGEAKVIAKAYSAAEGLTMLARISPDVLLLDLSLPDGNGIELCRQIKGSYPNLKILMLTSYGELSFIVRALDNGASGYILKNAMIDEVIEGIHTVAAGEQYLCDEVGGVMRRRAEVYPVRLSRRETELLGHIVAGLSNSEIAAAMFLGYETIKSYRKNLMLKLDVHNTAELVRVALELKLV